MVQLMDNLLIGSCRYRDEIVSERFLHQMFNYYLDRMFKFAELMMEKRRGE